MTSPPSSPPSPPSIRRRNSILTNVLLPTKLTLPTNTYGDVSSSSSYTSLKDLIPSSAVNTPTAGSAANSAYEISIRHRLVKQAAWAYLRPMSAFSPDSSAGSHFLRRIWVRISSACIQIINLLLSVFQVKEKEFAK